MVPDAPVPPIVPVSVAGAEVRGAWAADEIAIDFPAIVPIVARMREAFFGGCGDAVEALTADVALTAAQARRGGSVPVEVRVWRVCARCAGRGEIWDERCGRCAGLGHGMARHRLAVHVPSGVRDGMRMSFEVAPHHAPATRVHLRVAIR